MNEEKPIAIRTPGGKELTCFRFSQPTMGTLFEVILQGPDRKTCAQVSQTIFDEIRMIEGELSRFDPLSDVSRINSLRVGDRLKVSLFTFECLELAKQAYDRTHGAFDVTVGPLMQMWKRETKPAEALVSETRKKVGMDKVLLDKDGLTVEILTEGVRVDLGGIGKGYALDRSLEFLRDWRIPGALIHGGQSTVYAFGSLEGSDGWDVRFREGTTDLVLADGSARKLHLKDQALSGSGNLLHGPHIIDPRTGNRIEQRRYSWAIAPSGAESDALSTAFMVMTSEEIADYCGENPEVGAFLIQQEGENQVYRAFGEWLEGSL